MRLREPAAGVTGSARHDRRDIQGLRALAVSMVVLNHLLGWPSGGFVGVDVFFVVSGYLITSLLLREHSRSGSISARAFYSRRVKRIVPAAVTVVIVTLILSFLLTPGDRFLRTFVDSAWALLFSANWNLALQGTDYFQVGALPSPLQHYWSLAVEEQFYLVWPWLMLLVLSIGCRQFGWRERAQRVAAGCTIVVLTTASFMYSMALTAGSPSWAYFSSASRAWELGVGAIAAVAGGAVTSRLGRLGGPIEAVGLVGVVGSAFFISSGTSFPAPAALLPTVSTAVVLVAGQHRRIMSPLLAPLTNRLMTRVGDLSYSIYLWHFPIIVLLLAAIPASSPVYVPIALGLTAGLSAASYHFIENPIRKSGWLSAKKLEKGRQHGRVWSLPQTGVAVLGVLVFGLVLLVANDQRTEQAIAAQQAAEYSPPGDSASPRIRPCLGADVLVSSATCENHDYGSTTFPSPQAAAKDISQQFDCWSYPGDDMKSCRYGTGPVRVALVGDSHAAHLIPALRGEVRAARWTLTTFVGDSCIPVSPALPKCANAARQIFSATTVSNKFDMVVVSGSRLQGVTADSYAKYFRAVSASGAKLVVIADVPVIAQSAILCTQRIGFDPRTSKCTSPLSAGTAQPDPLLGAARVERNAHLINLSSLICSKTTCSDVIGNVIVYRDDRGHLTSTYSRTLGRYIIKDVARSEH